MVPKSTFEIATLKGRRRAQFSFDWSDHAILRRRWTNFEEFAPRAYRSNHPVQARFDYYHSIGIRTILTLRPSGGSPHYLFEAEACKRLGLKLECAPLSATAAPTSKQLFELFSVFDRLEKPFLMHCKSGADRTGLAAALYLMEFEDTPLLKAKKQLSFRFLHIRRARSGILDHFLEQYEVEYERSGVSIRSWAENMYCSRELTNSFTKKQAALRFWHGWH